MGRGVESSAGPAGPDTTAMDPDVSTCSLPQGIVKDLSSRLAQLQDVRLPAQLARKPGGASLEDRQRYLAQLLHHDPGVFLERHGSALTGAELSSFEVLRGDYEVDFYLRLLAEQENEGKQALLAKNRRLAKLNRLVDEGNYFSEKEMRERQPGLYHQYIGQYRPPEQPEGGQSCQAGSILADSIMRQQEELDLRQRQQAEQQQWDRGAERGEEESEESEEEELAGVEAAEGTQPAAACEAETAGVDLPPKQTAAAAAALGLSNAAAAGSNGAAAAAGEEPARSYVHIPLEEQQDYSAAFLDLMKQRFLAGQDAGVDYAAIDADAELDEDWAGVAEQDAADKYFDEGDD